MRPFPGTRSVVGRMLLLQVAIVLLLTVGAVAWTVLMFRRDAADDAARHSLGVAESFAQAPGMVAALRSDDPEAVLQPRVDAVEEGSDVDFVSVYDERGIRQTRPEPGVTTERLTPSSLATLLAGQAVQGHHAGPRGEVVRTAVPIRDGGGTVVGAVNVGVLERNAGAQVAQQLPALLGTAAAAVVATTAGTTLVGRRLMRRTRGLSTTEIMRLYEHHDAVLHAAREGVVIADDRRRLLLVNDEAQRLLDLPARFQGRPVGELPLAAPVAELLCTGREASDEVHLVGSRVLSVNQRSLDRYGVPSGTVMTLRDSTELQEVSGRAEAAAARLGVLYEASVAIGTTLSVTRTAEELAEVAVPRFADHVTVDLAEAVLRGNEPPAGVPRLRRVAVAPTGPGSGLRPVGEPIGVRPRGPQAAGMASRQAVLSSDVRGTPGPWAQSTEDARRMLDQGFHSLITAPLGTGGSVLGVADFWRSGDSRPFDADDLALVSELAAHTAICVDNARRYTREHALAETLQRSLLPHSLPDQSLVDVAHRYLPARDGVGGDWFDVIPLPGARVALVVGDVVGHGLHAAATMGRLRTAVHNFSALDLPPDELLGHLDELASRIDGAAGAEGDGDGFTGATCLYAVYDATSGACVLARSGHPEPALVHPDGTVEYLEVPVSPPLGLGGGIPFETAEVTLAEGSRLVLYTDGLVEDRVRGIDAGLEALRKALAHQDRSSEETCQDVLDALLPARSNDDVALLVARTRRLDPSRVAQWDVPEDPAVVAGVRADVTRQLDAWGLDETLVFNTELMISELVTNAIRYATGPIRLRVLTYHDNLVCEVADGSSTSPHLRRAATTDEGGRGLFLVAQFARRWGTRYTARGKVIWTEQSLHRPSPEVQEATADELLDQWNDAAW
ncbi:SpoIIE family protein phosphatase/ATP-binding protein [Streptomyces hyderabadensis]|uniref:SpoIIE family protein phosphatase/ATP-binding protein n=2 Tax=Streptomyces hyderabadensis TaxID=598549 RepID=A0ABP9I843_9ACTN|nr:SpoIIE family protein phosphatase [Streptomyces hyderabadensis]